MRMKILDRVNEDVVGIERRCLVDPSQTFQLLVFTAMCQEELPRLPVFQCEA